MKICDVTAVAVDDQLTQLRHIGGVASQYGFQLVGVAQDGIAGWLSVQRHEPTIAILDILLPQLDGVSILRRIIEQKLNTVPIMASGSSQEKKKAAELGARFFLTKPYDPRRMWNEIAKILEEIGVDCG